MRFDDVHSFLIKLDENSVGFSDVLKLIRKNQDIKEPGIDKIKKGPRTQKWGTGQGRLHQNMVPAVHRVDNTKNHKIETLRGKDTGKFMLDNNDIKYIVAVYKISNLTPDIKKDNPKFLGNSGIKVYFDDGMGPTGNYCIEK